jgi:hypothetical protein
MKRYQFACNARLSFEVEAESLDKAVEVWDCFRDDLESGESVSTEGHHTFSVSLPDEGPEIYDGSSVFDREGNLLE